MFDFAGFLAFFLNQNMDLRSEEMNEIEQAQTENKNSRKDAKKEIYK